MNSPTILAGATKLVILVAEDNEYDRLFLQEAFAELGLEATLRFVEDGQELLDYISLARRDTPQDIPPCPSIVLLDLNMPRMTGNEAMRILRADPNWRTLPIVVLSTSNNDRQIAQAYADGANAFITKPGHFDDFVAFVRTFAAFWLETAKLPSVKSTH